MAEKLGRRGFFGLLAAAPAAAVVADEYQPFGCIDARIDRDIVRRVTLNGRDVDLSTVASADDVAGFVEIYVNGRDGATLWSRACSAPLPPSLSKSGRLTLRPLTELRFGEVRIYMS